MEDLSCTPSCILLTHGHFDHTGAVAKLLAHYPGLPVYLNQRDVYRGEDYHLRQYFPALPETIDYGEGDQVQVGDLHFSVLHTPGHTPGSVVLLCGDLLFSGDTLFAGSCGRTDLPGGDSEEMFRSLARLGRLEGEYRVLPGHMEPSVLSREKALNLFMRQALQLVQ
jgi:glyoxylase-like metal-dependent hydrolase (beta-lactamase superfamily II)